jgi:phytoene dehydrogenase-like protein
MDTDYLILGSGLSALTFGALMAKAGRRVVILEAHEYPGGYGHTFVEKSQKYEYHFNAQFHYVWDCGEGDPVNLILKKLGLDKEVTFLKYDEDGFDHMRVPGYALNIPSDFDLLLERLAVLFPRDMKQIKQFIALVRRVSLGVSRLRRPARMSYVKHAVNYISCVELLKYYNTSLQQVFDSFNVPKPAQTLLANQWLDFLLPPKKLSFYAFCVLFDGYVRGAYYPKHHFEHVINSLVKVINEHGGQIIYNTTVTDFIKEKNKIIGINSRDTNQPDLLKSYHGKNIISNMDPKFTAELIGMENFSTRVRKQLEYDYSYSNFIVYGAVKDIDLREFGFGSCNLFHSESLDLNSTIDAMHDKRDYSQIAFGMATPSIATDDKTGCPEGQQLFAMLTIANYQLFEYLKLRDTSVYNKAKSEIFNRMLDIVERDYVPNFREHISFKMLGSPTTNRSYCWSPEGNSYGMNLTPENMGLGKLGFNTSIKNLYFCNASSGSPGFAKSFNNGAMLYEDLTGDPVF